MTSERYGNQKKARCTNGFQRVWLSVRPSRRPSVRDREMAATSPKRRRRWHKFGSDLLANSASIPKSSAAQPQTIKPYWYTYPLLIHPYEPHPRRSASLRQKKGLRP